MTAHVYPVRVEARLDHDLSRGLWLVKWILAIPHYVVLAFLWMAFLVLSVGAWVAILVTGRYPRTIFDFNVGVLRWSWRVAYYSYAGLGTDRYPPFTLAEVPDYPATLEIAYPHHLSRGLALVKWWLLALPHYLVIGFFMGAGTYVAFNQGEAAITLAGGLIGLSVLIAAVMLLFTGRYPRGLFDFVLGMNRWVVRVAAYAALMTDDYPPFRFDAGGTEPAIVAGGTADRSGASAATIVEEPPAQQSDATPGPGRPWTVGRVVAVVVGSVMVLGGLVQALAGGGLLWLDATQRDDAGYVTSGSARLATPSYAIRSESFRLDGVADWGDLAGRVRVNAAAAGDQELFVGIGTTADVAAYLSDVDHVTLTDLDTAIPGSVGDNPTFDRHDGGEPAVPTESSDVWAASAVGAGTVTLDWAPQSGSWAVVVMNADGSAGVVTDATVGAQVPAIDTLGTALLVGGLVILIVGAVIVTVATVRRP